MALLYGYYGVIKMTNEQKFKEHEQLKSEIRRKGVIHTKPEVYEMEKLKYSDDPLLRKACAIIEIADEMQMDAILGKSVTALFERLVMLDLVREYYA
jgi:hypothetical protein